MSEQTEMCPVVQVFVPGVAAPKGSTRGFVVGGRAVVTESNSRVRPWAALVRDAVRQRVGEGVWATGGVSVDLAFRLPRPKSLPKKVAAHLKKPDVDKLTRAVLDACTGTLWVDDAQVVHLSAMKRYVLPEETPGLVVTARQTGVA